MRVLKFGGTSVANAQRFLGVSDIVINTATQEPVALVLSAPAGITNLLVDLVRAGVEGGSGQEQFARIRDIIGPLIAGLHEAHPDFDRAMADEACRGMLEEIGRRIQGVALLGQCPDNVAAFIESRGEFMSVLVMAELLRARGYPSRTLDPVSLLVTEGGIMEASVSIEASRERYAALGGDAAEAITIMPGFCGGDGEGGLVLLGRNGSDYSAACLAAIVRASCCEIWTDVDGVYSCDPRAVPDALLLRRMSYKEAMELSYFGAKVLHPRTIAPIAQFRIPCLIKNTANPQAEGTLIAQDTDPAIPIKGISDLKGISLVNVSGPGMKGMVGMAGRLFSAVSRANVSIVLITQSSSEYSITFCIYTQDGARALRAINTEFALELRVGILDPVEVVDERAIISVVGDGMRTTCGIAGRFFRSLAQANINVNAIAQGSSERSISAVISQGKVAEAISVCHMRFFSALQLIDLVVIGVGGVGGELLRQIARQRESLRRHQGIEIRVVGIANSRNFVVRPLGMDPENYAAELEAQEGPFSPERLKQLVEDSHLVNPVLVDCTSDEQLALSYLEFMESGYHVVTPNKKANTLSVDYYRSLRRIARAHNRKFLYEANVGAGLPVINTLQNLFAAGDRLIEFSGIMSGTLSYIFGLVEDGMTLSQATREAHSRGFTEPNPRDDLDGMDVARKVLILARECGYRIELSDIDMEGVVEARYLAGDSAEAMLESLRGADHEFSQRVDAARSEGRVLRYVARISPEGRCSCRVQAVGSDNPLFRVRDGENALAFTSSYYHPIPLVIRGYGAGTEVTAAGVLADILRLQNWTREG